MHSTHLSPWVRGQHLGQGRDFVPLKNLTCGHHIHASKSKERNAAELFTAQEKQLVPYQLLFNCEDLRLAHIDLHAPPAHLKQNISVLYIVLI